MGLLSNLFDPGRGDRSNASQIANSAGAQVTGGSFSGPFGISGGVGFVGPHQRAQVRGDLGQLEPIARNLLQSAQFGRGAADLGFMDQIMSGSMQDLQDPNLQSLVGRGQFQGLGRLFSSALGTATADPFALGAQTTETLRQQAMPENQRAVNSTLSRLFSQGRLGLGEGTTGGDRVINRLAESQNQQDLGFQLAGMQAGQSLQSDALQRLMSGFQGTESMAGRLFGEQATAAGMRGQFAGQRFGQGATMADLLMRNLVQGQNIGLSSLGAATGIAQLPLAFQNAALQASIAQSNANLSRAGVQQNNASMARSPMLEGLSAIGQFFEPIKFGGPE